MCRGFESLLRYQQLPFQTLKATARCSFARFASPQQEGRSREGAAFHRVWTSGLGQVQHAILGWQDEDGAEVIHIGERGAGDDLCVELFEEGMRIILREHGAG